MIKHLPLAPFVRDGLAPGEFPSRNLRHEGEPSFHQRKQRPDFTGWLRKPGGLRSAHDESPAGKKDERGDESERRHAGRDDA